MTEKLLGKVEIWTRDSADSDTFTVQRHEVFGECDDLDRAREEINKINSSVVDPAMRSAFPKEKGE